MKVFLLGTLFLCCLLQCEASLCVKRTFTDNNIDVTPEHFRYKRSQPTLEQIMCYNVTESVFIDANYNIQPYRQELLIHGSIPKLPTNSSLSRFTHIQSLSLSGTDLEEVEPGAFSELVHLEELNLNVNKLTKISSGMFNNLKHLKYLDISSNRITKIEENSFAGLDKVTVLDIFDNRMTSFRQNLFSDLKNLNYLSFSNNPLRNFSQSDFPNLENLISYKSNLKTINLNLSNSPLVHIKLIRAKIEEVDFSKFPAKKLIEFQQNRISSVLHWEKIDCEIVDLRHNRIRTFDIPANVSKLFLSHNLIDTFENNFSSRDKKVKELDLAFNKISKIGSNSFRRMDNLQILKLKHNEIVVLKERTFSGAPKIRKLYLNNNKISTIEENAFVGLKRLNHLDISGNRLARLEAPILSELKKGNVVVDNGDIDWLYMITLINKRDSEVSFQLEKQLCIYLNPVHDQTYNNNKATLCRLKKSNILDDLLHVRRN